MRIQSKGMVAWSSGSPHLNDDLNFLGIFSLNKGSPWAPSLDILISVGLG